MYPAVIRRGVPFALASKTEGRGRGIFFSPHSPLEQVPLYGEASLKSWGAVLLYALVCGMTNQLIKRGVGRGGWQVHLYGEAARCVPLRDLFELLGKGSQAGAPKWWSYELRGCCRRGLGITFVARASGCTYMVELLQC